MVALVRAVVVALVLAAATPAAGQLCPPSWSASPVCEYTPRRISCDGNSCRWMPDRFRQPQATTHPPAHADAIVRVANKLPGKIYYGSGALVYRGDRLGLVLTCRHTFDRGQGDIEVQFRDGRRYGAKLAALDQTWDLGGLIIARPHVEPLPIADGHAQPGDEVTLCGYGENGRLVCRSGPVITYGRPKGADKNATMFARAFVRQGDSGGPTLDQAGRLVGVTWGGDDRTHTASATYAGQVREFLETGTWQPWRRNQNRTPGCNGNNSCPGGVCPLPNQAEPDLVPVDRPAATIDTAGLEKSADKIAAAIADLVEMEKARRKAEAAARTAAKVEGAVAPIASKLAEGDAQGAIGAIPWAWIGTAAAVPVAGWLGLGAGGAALLGLGLRFVLRRLGPRVAGGLLTAARKGFISIWERDDNDEPDEKLAKDRLVDRIVERLKG